MDAKFPTTLFTYLSVNETNGIIFAKEETLDEGQVVSEHETTYLEYYDMTKSEFENVLDRYANKDLFEKKEGKWKPKFVIDNEFYL